MLLAQQQQQQQQQNKPVFYNAAGRPVGGSYSSKTGCSSKLIGDHCNIAEESAKPKLAQVAKALMAAKQAGLLPSALNRPEDALKPKPPADPNAPAPAPGATPGQPGQPVQPGMSMTAPASTNLSRQPSAVGQNGAAPQPR